MAAGKIPPVHLALTDNFGYLIHDPATKATASIDAPEAGPRRQGAGSARGWSLTDILVTHHHHDHVGGIAELKQKYHCRVVAPRNDQKGEDRQCRSAHRQMATVGEGREPVGAGCWKPRAIRSTISLTFFDGDNNI